MCIKLQALLFLLALIVRAVNRPADYDSDDELINPRQQVRQPLLHNRQAGPPSGLPVAGTTDQRPNRNDAWSTRMREKVQSLFFFSTLYLIVCSADFHVFVLTRMHTNYLRRIALDSTILVWVLCVYGFDFCLPVLCSCFCTIKSMLSLEEYIFNLVYLSTWETLT